MTEQVLSDLNATEVQSLYSLAWQLDPPVTSMSRVLQPFLDVMRAKWCRDFIFTPSDIHIPYLLSPTLSTTALTCYMKSTSIDSQAPTPMRSWLPGESHSLSANVLFAPVFTADGITLGVGAMNADIAMAAPWIENTAKDRSMKLNLRFARDGESQTLLLVYEAPQDDCFLVYTSTLESSTKGRRFTGIFRRRPLRDAVLNEDGKLKLSDVSHALMVAQEEVHYRDCPMCGAPSNSCVGCDLRLSKPSHPLDHSYFASGMARHTCNTRSVAFKTIFDNGCVRKQVKLGSRQAMGGIADARVMDGLTKWSVAEFCGRQKMDPLESVHFTGSLIGTATTTHESGQLDNSFSEHDTQLAEIGGGAESPSSSPVTCLAPMFPGLSQKSSALEDSQPFALSEPRSESGDLYEAVFGAQSIGSHRDNFGMEDEGWWDGNRIHNGVGSKGEVVDNAAGARILSGVRRERTSLLEATEYGAGFPDGNEDLDKELAKMIKAEQRKQRNRESARRSNHRNKARREELKRELEATYDRIEELHAKEINLRRENLRLRREYAVYANGKAG